MTSPWTAPDRSSPSLRRGDDSRWRRAGGSGGEGARPALTDGGRKVLMKRERVCVTGDDGGVDGLLVGRQKATVLM